MNCDRALEAIQRALDADPSAPPPPEVVRHVEGCEECRGAWEELREVESLVSRLHADEEIEPPRSLHAGIMDAVARRDRPAAPARRLRPAPAALRWGLAAAAFLGMAAILHGVLTRPAKPKGGGIVQLERSLSVVALASHRPDFDFKRARNRVLRNALAPERLAALAGRLPLPGVSAHEPNAPGSARPDFNRPKSATAAVPGQVTETLEHLWGVGESTLQFLSGSHGPAP